MWSCMHAREIDLEFIDQANVTISSIKIIGKSILAQNVLKSRDDLLPYLANQFTAALNCVFWMYLPVVLVFGLNLNAVLRTLIFHD